MIKSLYIFSVGSYVVADEWNANFKTLAESNTECTQAVADAENVLAFPDSDLSDLFSAVKRQPNSFAIPGLSVTVAPECEYYKTLGSGEELQISIPQEMNGESRILLKILENRSLKPYSILYNGTLIENHDDSDVYHAGCYYVMIYETAGTAMVKLIWTGE